MDYFICTRSISKNAFGNEAGKTTYLEVPPEDTTLLPSRKISMSDFLGKIINTPKEDIVIFIHGFNTTCEETLDRHRVLQAGLKKSGFTGDLITFAWPSGHNSLLYLEDRHDAKNVAMELVSSGIALLAKQQGKDCTLNVHVIAHSTGAYIIKEAFDDSETTKSTAEVNWTLAQLLFISGDVSSDSMAQDCAETIYRHCNRFTNYFSPHDQALAVSNVKRVGAKNRVGRVGLPDNIPGKAVDVDCGEYYIANKDNLNVTNGMHSHSWYFYSDSWLKDATETIVALIDRNVINTRTVDGQGNLRLK